MSHRMRLNAALAGVVAAVALALTASSALAGTEGSATFGPCVAKAYTHTGGSYVQGWGRVDCSSPRYLIARLVLKRNGVVVDDTGWKGPWYASAGRWEYGKAVQGCGYYQTVTHAGVWIPEFGSYSYWYATTGTPVRLGC